MTAPQPTTPVWASTPNGSRIEVSFEFFPPATDAGVENLDRCVEALSPLAPAFMSVTYGARGTDQGRTARTLSHLAEMTAAPLAGHITCVGATREQVQEVIDSYVEAGITRIVAPRGDPPACEDDGSVAGGYHSAVELVEGIRARPDGSIFDISVAAYPEVHPRARSARSDLDNLKAKVDAGADRLITQFFYDNERFLRFRDEVERLDIGVPLVPGIMPIMNFARIANFAQRCGAVIPGWLEQHLAGLDGDAGVQPLVSAALVSAQCRELADHEVSEFHFYTMNRAELSVAACHMLGIVTDRSDP
jgi:methylenetetrahydrofolate reductase (NADPH)